MPPLSMTEQAPGKVPPRGWILGAPSSNTGKTLVAAALIRLMKRQGKSITPYKVGPDYIDPGFLSVAAARTCHNLDPWAMEPDRLDQLLGEQSGGQSGDFFLIEGVMGLFDGAISGEGSTADLAAAYNLPVILVINARGQGASVAALAQGFINHRADVNVAGVIFTQVGSTLHRTMLQDACETADIKVFGYLASDARFVLHERHLGLVQASERADLEFLLEQTADCLEKDLDMAALLESAARPKIESSSPPLVMPPIVMPPLGQHIAIAHDIAFGFSYSHIFEDWRAQGASISFFSPLDDQGPDKTCDAVYLPGGYPELHGGQLSSNQGFMAGLRQAAKRKAVIYGECGGYMVLGRGLVDRQGTRHAMAGLLDLETSFAEPKRHLGYRQISLKADCVLGRSGTEFRGHEFHYSSVLDEHGERLLTVCNALGQGQKHVGLIADNVMGSFMHLIDRTTEKV